MKYLVAMTVCLPNYLLWMVRGSPCVHLSGYPAWNNLQYLNTKVDVQLVNRCSHLLINVTVHVCVGKE